LEVLEGGRPFEEKRRRGEIELGTHRRRRRRRREGERERRREGGVQRESNKGGGR
jgi:hypothetical protein